MYRAVKDWTESRSKTALMVRYRHFKNLPGPGETAFATTSAIERVNAFHRNELKELMLAIIWDDHRYYKAVLHGFVVMPNHIHFLCKLPGNMGASKFLQALKKHAAQTIRPMLEPSMARLLETLGPKSRVFWQEGFRAIPVEGEDMFRQKLDYMHYNPVKRGLCELPEDWLCSSARFFNDGCWNPETGLMEACDWDLVERVILAAGGGKWKRPEI